MNPCSASTSGGIEERRKAPIRQPVRIHELLGLPKSTGKTKDHQRSQPVRIKHSAESTEIRNRQTIGSSARRTYREAANATLPNESMLMDGESDVKPLNNAASHNKFQQARLLGFSKSDGKAKTNDQRSQPIKIKQILESMEKSRNAKLAGRKSRMGGVTTKNVRRKLYSFIPSPVTSLQTGIPVKPDAEESVKAAVTLNPLRKSCILPPNSIRNKHISLQANRETIVEESAPALSSGTEDVTNSEKSCKGRKLEVENAAEIPKMVIFPEQKSPARVSPATDSVVPGSSQEVDKVCEAHVEIPRPSVIIGLGTPSSESNSESEFALLRPPLQELNRNSLMPLQRLDAADTSLEDLLGNSRVDRQNSFRSSDLPCNSFLRNFESSKESLGRMDRQTLLWLHGNMKLCVQTTEESLFSMKQMLKTIEDIVENSSEPEEQQSQTSTDITVRPKILIEDTCEEQNIFEGRKETSREEDKENLWAVHDKVEKEKNEENGAKTRRRSARLASIQSRSSEDSFSRIEAELHITHAKSKPTTPRRATPAKRTPLDPRSRRSIREYMALKSCVKFLQTPDHKGLPTPKCNKSGTPAERRAAEIALSRQLLSQLNDLYDDSPE